MLLFKELVIGEDGLSRGPFGSDLKKSLFVDKSIDTYKVYIQENIFKEDSFVGDYYISKEYYDKKMNRYVVHNNDFIVTCDGTLGEIFQIKEPFEQGIISSSLLRISLNPELIDYNYFYYLFKWELKKRLITKGNNSVLNRNDSRNSLLNSKISQNYFGKKNNKNNMSLPNAGRILKRTKDIQIRIKNDKDKFFINNKKYIDLFEDHKIYDREKGKNMKLRILKKHQEISRKEAYEKEKIEEVKGLFDKIIDDFEQ